MERGLVDANLGGRIIKKRIRVTGRGKSGGARVLVATNSRDRWFFVYGFLKNERSNITQRELLALRSLARDLLSLTEEQLNEETHRGALTQVR